jgi:uncharacterized HhH-GPD family protein
MSSARVAKPSFAPTDDPEANDLLAREPLALLIGMMLDQQVPMERAFSAPLELKRRLGHLDATRLAAMNPEALEKAFSGPPALHRFPKAMAARCHELCSIVAQEHGGRAERIWSSAPDAREVLKRISRLPGFSEEKAKILIALLAKRLGWGLPGWEEASAPYSRKGVFMSVADVDSPEARLRVRATKKEAKAKHSKAARKG